MIVGVDNQQYQTMRIVSLGCWVSEQKRQVKSISWGSEEKIPMSPTATPEIARVALAGLDPNVVCVCTDEGQRGMRVSRQNIRGVRNCEGARIMPWDI
jgi:predicted nuclease with TOPRIM domain